ncbi:hypothetical protein ACFL09_04050 [Planctomycetota bacterium]
MRGVLVPLTQADIARCQAIAAGRSKINRRLGSRDGRRDTTRSSRRIDVVGTLAELLEGVEGGRAVP